MKNLFYVFAWCLLWFVALAMFGFIARVMWESLRLGWNLL